MAEGVSNPFLAMAVSMRAVFPNKQLVLRSGGMANVIFPYTMEDIILIPQSATQEIRHT